MRLSAAAAGLLLLANWGAAAQDLPPLEDPIFHLSVPETIYAKGLIAVPEDVMRECKVTVKASSAYRYWLLAAAEAGDARFLIIAGMVQSQAGGGSWQDDRKGSFLRLSAAGCTPIDPADEVFENYAVYAEDPQIRIDKPVFTALAADAVARFAHAYGSKEAFLAVLREQHKYPDRRGNDLLRNALEK